MKSCKGCPKYYTCKTPCKAVDEYADQDHVSRKGWVVYECELGISIDSLVPDKFSAPEIKFSLQQMTIWELYLNDVSKHEIAKRLNLDRSYVIRTIKKLAEYYGVANGI